MEAHTSTTLEALERTAAWVQQCQVQVEQMKNSQESKTMETTVEEMTIVDEDNIKTEPSDKDDNSLTDHHDEALKMAQAFPPYVPRGKNGGNNYSHIDVHATVKEFKEALEKFGISQRFACIHIMENTSQGNLSFLLDKGKNKLWSEISPRGRIPYIRMRQWLDSPKEQQATLGLLSKSKDNKKTYRNGVDSLMNKREKFSVFQLLVLCRVFEEDANPSLSTRALLADKLEAPLERITIWFQNQRARGFPAAKLLRESNLGKDSGINLSSLAPKKDLGMKKSDTPLSNGNASASNTLPLDYSKLSATPQSNEASSSTVHNPSSTVAQSMSYAQMPALPLQLMNMPMTSEQLSIASTLQKGQTFASYPGFAPHIYTSAQSKNNTAVNDAINFLTMFPQVNIKQEPQDSMYESQPTSTS